MPIFQLVAVRSTSLEENKIPSGLDPYVYRARTEITFGVPDDVLTGKKLPMRLDTGAEVSMIPSRWFEGKMNLIGPLSRKINLSTAAGPNTASGRMAKDVLVRFTDSPRYFSFNLFVTPNLTDFGLLSLRDIHNNFQITQSRRPLVSPDHSVPPMFLGNIILTPWE